MKNYFECYRIHQKGQLESLWSNLSREAKIIPLTFHSDPLLNESPKFPHNLKITGNITKKLVTGLYILFPPTVQGSVDITTRTCNKEVYYFSIAHLSITKSPHS